MTPNIERVAEVMKTHDLFCYKYGNGWTEPHEEVIRCACGEEFYSYIQTGDGSYDDDRDPDALYRQHLTQALADSGLLTPDLPEMRERYGTVVNDGVIVDDRGLWVRYGVDDTPLDPGEARDLAYALLAAANHAEKENRA